MSMFAKCLSLSALMISVLGCKQVPPNTGPDFDLERMIRQRKCIPYSTCEWLPDNRTMQPSPPGTVPRSRIVGEPGLTRGEIDGQPVHAIPLEVDAALMLRGRSRFEIFCAACHGVLGNGDTKVAEHMHLRRPPSLHESRIADYPPGRLFRIIGEGYGLMPGFDPELSLEDRWAVVAYVGALQLSQRVVLSEQPEEIRDVILEVLP